MSGASRMTLVAFALVAVACKPGAGKASPSAREECARVTELAEKERKRIPPVEELGAPRMEVNAAKGVRDYAAKLDAVPVTDKELNNKLADYGDQLRKMAKALDELWTARDDDKPKYLEKAQRAMTDEYKFVNELNDYCQSAR